MPMEHYRDYKATAGVTGKRWRISDAHGLCIETEDRTATVADFSPAVSAPGWEGRREDAEFIVYARNHWDTLVRQRDTLRQQLQQAEDRLRDALAKHPPDEKQPSEDSFCFEFRLGSVWRHVGRSIRVEITDWAADQFVEFKVLQYDKNKDLSNLAAVLDPQRFLALFRQETEL